MEKPTFFARRALLILVVVFFFVPFALRGARMAVQGMKNDVKDWLPKEFEETRDLDDFRKHFLSEQFVLVSWDGCYGDGKRRAISACFVAKLTPESPPSLVKRQAEAAKSAADQAAATSRTAIKPLRPVHLPRCRRCWRSISGEPDAAKKPRSARSSIPRAISTATTISSATSSASTTPASWHENWGEQRREMAARTAPAPTRARDEALVLHHARRRPVPLGRQSMRPLAALGPHRSIGPLSAKKSTGRSSIRSARSMAPGTTAIRAACGPSSSRRSPPVPMCSPA